MGYRERKNLISLFPPPSAENSELLKVFPFKAGVRENLASHVSPAAKKSICLISAFSVHSTSFPLDSPPI